MIFPESWATSLRIHPKGATVWNGEWRRRDADGGGRDDRAPQKFAKDSGKFSAWNFQVDVFAQKSLQKPR
jgi:hypothetical protein